ncbi:MAG: 2-hydroxy-3-keto-5-methylthiopentenyl-1-phosphate phosphatase [Chrysiogenales bacterium]|nr:MAG: 2-hydroxy-3-keto-5-methylthiopentenyl-1-phosphate phosphatase [Chrysiogenales bacterium]
MTSFKRAVFCDFDGTITSEETLSGMVRRVVPDRCKEVLPEMLARRMTLREGVQTLVESIPSGRYGEIIEYVMAVPMRPGLEELLDFLNPPGIPFIVISGGLRGMVEARLGPLAKRVKDIYAVDVDTGGEYIRISSHFQSKTELMDKPRVMSRYAADEIIAIGDGFTDINMALASQLVFARDALAQNLQKRGKEFVPWNDFYDIRRELERRF